MPTSQEKIMEALSALIPTESREKVSGAIDAFLKETTESLDAEYDAKNLTAGYRDCNVKVGLAFELDNTSGGVSFKDILRPQNDSTRIGVKKSCFGLGAFVSKELQNCHSDSSRLYFVCELQLILQVRSSVASAFLVLLCMQSGCGQSHTWQSLFTYLKTDEESHKRYVQRRDSLAS